MLSTIIIIITLIQIAVGQYSETAAVVGAEAKLKCRTDIEGSINVMWWDPEKVLLTINDDVQTNDDRITVDQPYRGEWILKIDNVHETDAGNYTCQIDAMNKVVNLAIHAPPIMETDLSDVSVVAGSDVSITCTASGRPLPQINWYKHTLENQKELLASDQSSLHLVNVTKESAGTYECEAVNGVKPIASDHIEVNVQFLPILTLPYHSFSQRQGRDTLLECLVTANPLSSHYWMKGGVRIEDSEKYRIQKWDVSAYTYILGVFVISLTEEDFGTYVCVAGNKFGSVNESLEIFETIHKGSVEVVDKPRDVVTKLGQTIRINCTITGETSRDNLKWWRRTAAGNQTLFESNPPSDSSQEILNNNNNKNSNHNNNNQNNDDNKRETYTHSGTNVPGNSGIALSGRGILRGRIKDVVLNAKNRRLEERVEIDGHYNLVLHEAEEGDGGTYACELVGHRNYTAQVTVVENVTCVSNDTDILQGEMLNISCSLRYHGNSNSTDNDFVVSWQHEERKMSSIHHDEPALLRRTVSFRAWDTDTGTYKCEVESGDKRFKDSCETVMQVKEPPPETMTPPIDPPTGAPSTDIKTNLSMMGIVLGGALVVITLVLLMILGCTVKYYRNELEKYKIPDNSTKTLTLPEEDCEFKSPPIITLSGNVKQDEAFRDNSKSYDNVGYMLDRLEPNNDGDEVSESLWEWGNQRGDGITEDDTPAGQWHQPTRGGVAAVKNTPSRPSKLYLNTGHLNDGHFV